MEENINVCCRFLAVIDCADTEEHKHIGCEVKNELDENPIIDNEYAKVHCVSEDFKACPYYPKQG